MPLRYQVFVTYGVGFMAIWCYCLLNKSKISASSQQTDLTITFAPIIAIIAFGIYLLLRLILGVLALEDCPTAAKEIETQIIEAKSEMKRRNVIA
jgi:Dolichol-phosphate mannosyltransferase subunit 3 (DPM3)